MMPENQFHCTRLYKAQLRFPSKVPQCLGMGSKDRVLSASYIVREVRSVREREREREIQRERKRETEVAEVTSSLSR